jgi:signal peptidase I
MTMRGSRLARSPVAAALLLAALASLALAGARRRLTRVEVAGESMLPGLAPGDFVLVRLGAPSPTRAAGAVIVLKPPRARAVPARPQLLLKRIVGLPGEMLRIGAAVEVNGRILEEPYRRGIAAESGYRDVQAVSAGHYCVLGDNRAESTDSRDFGEIPADRILGVAAWRYWPPGRFGPIGRPERRWRASDRPST